MATPVLNAAGVFTYEERVYLYFTGSSGSSLFDMAVSEDGFFFERVLKDLSINTSEHEHSGITADTNFRIIPSLSGETTYWLFSTGGKKVTLASSSNLINWSEKTTLPTIKNVGVIVPDYLYKGQFVMYTGGKKIRLSYSQDGITWKNTRKPVLESRKGNFDKGSISVENAFLTEKGILILYHSQNKLGKKTHYSVGAALFDKEQPDVLLWRSQNPVWQSEKEWADKKVKHIGVVKFRDRFISYWNVEGLGIWSVVYSFYKFHIPGKTRHVSLNLKKSAKNPIIAPRLHNAWEAFNTLNAGAVYTGGKVHILYRAQGHDYVSVIGYASSNDGVHIDERPDKPVYLPGHIFEIPNGNHHTEPNKLKYGSGGGWGGCEDPRVTEIDGRIYMTYVAHDGMSEPRLALTSISVEDFLNKRWFWEKPVLISPPGIVDKSGCILPEKINGKYAIFHRVFPDILIDYVDDLNFNGDKWLKEHDRISVRRDFWDSRKIGAGAPPIKTKDGWLLIYYAVDDKEASRYKIGAMLLDLKNPAKVLHRTNAPILEPTEKYENEGFKAGITYPCGAVVINDTLFVYYGGADTVVCVATADLNHFLSELKYSEMAKLEPAIIRQVK